MQYSSLSFILSAYIFGAELVNVVEARRLAKHTTVDYQKKTLQQDHGAFNASMHPYVCGNAFHVMTYGLLGSGIDHGAFNPHAGPVPDKDTVILDPAGLWALQQGHPGGSMGASAANYKYFDVRSFPEDVTSSVTEELQAKLHVYQKGPVLHVVGPDLWDVPDKDMAIKKLTTAYSNVLKEFANSKFKKLRLLPISGGQNGGQYQSIIHELTFEALDRAIRTLNDEEAAALQEAEVGMYLFVKEQGTIFQKELDRHCKNTDQDDSMDTSEDQEGTFGSPCGKTFNVVRYGILGSGITVKGGFDPHAGPVPDAHTVILDPAGLYFIQHGPQGAGGAAGAMYKYLNLHSFPDEVSTSITDVLMAKLHVYPKGPVIHVVGPDLGGSQENAAIELLTTAYSNVLKEFAKSGFKKLRLLPISGGIFSGQWSHKIHEFTFTALGNAISGLNDDEAAALQAADVEMCIFNEHEALKFETEADRICKEGWRQ